MKKIIILFLAGIAYFQSGAQGFWKETFGNGCNQGQVANVVVTPTNGAWSVTNLTLPFLNGPEANEWFISASEQGQFPLTCGGITCGGTNNRTLHIGRNKPIPPPGVVDVGASYYGGSGSYTNKRAETPVIDCSGKNFIQLSFTYILGGIPGNDFCDLEYSTDGGNTWNFLINLPQTNNASCGLQGLWTFYAVGLPQTVANNNNVKIGFHWYNNHPTGGSPSVAIDEMYLSELFMNTADTVNCVAATATAAVTNPAIANASYTWAAMPNTVTFTPVNGNSTSIQYPGVGTYTVRVYGSNQSNSLGTSTAQSIVNVNFGSTPMVSATSNSSLLCAGNSAVLTASGATSYSWNTSAATSTISVSPTANTIYTVTGTSGYCVSAFTIQQMVDPCTAITSHALRTEDALYPNPFDSELHVFVSAETEVVIANALGKELMRVTTSENKVINTSDLPKGIYFVEFVSKEGRKKVKLLKN